MYPHAQLLGLPLEILDIIWWYLGIMELKTLSEVCKTGHKIAHSILTVYKRQKRLINGKNMIDSKWLTDEDSYSQVHEAPDRNFFVRRTCLDALSSVDDELLVQVKNVDCESTRQHWCPDGGVSRTRRRVYLVSSVQARAWSNILFVNALKLHPKDDWREGIQQQDRLDNVLVAVHWKNDFEPGSLWETRHNTTLLEVMSCANKIKIDVFNIDGSHNLTDLKPLKNTRAVRLANCDNLVDISPLGKAKIVLIENCTRVLDVNALRFVNHVELLDFPLITDVSALNTVKELTLRFCEGVTDVSALGTVNKLVIQMCSGIKDISALGTVKELTLMWCHGITNVSTLGTVKKLMIYQCNGIKNVSELGSVKNLKIWRCRNIIDVSALGTVEQLTLEWCHGITDVSALGSVKNLKLRNCDGIKDVSALCTVKKLSILKCRWLVSTVRL